MKYKVNFICDNCRFEFTTKLKMDFCPKCGRNELVMLSKRDTSNAYNQ